MYYTVIKHDGHLRTKGKCRKHKLQVSDFYIPQVICYDNYRDNAAKNNKRHFFYVVYFDKTWVFDQSDHAQEPVYNIICQN